MPITGSPPSCEDAKELSYLHPYHPYYSDKFDRASGRILDFKEGDPEAFQYYFRAMNTKLEENVTVTAVPPHAPGKEGAVRRLARRLARCGNRTDATSCLIRHEEIQKLSNGGRRDISVHLGSVRVVESQLVTAQEVTLVDDVTTTGNSFRACRELLLNAGAQSVRCFALAKTMR